MIADGKISHREGMWVGGAMRPLNRRNANIMLRHTRFTKPEPIAVPGDVLPVGFPISIHFETFSVARKKTRFWHVLRCGLSRRFILGWATLARSCWRWYSSASRENVRRKSVLRPEKYLLGFRNSVSPSIAIRVDMAHTIGTTTAIMVDNLTFGWFV